MKHFTFRLRTLLDLREHAEQSAKEALARELAVQAARTAELETAAARVDGARTRAAAALSTLLPASELAARQRFIERCEHEHDRAEIQSAEQCERVEEERASLARAAQDRQALENLKRRKRAAHERIEAQHEDLLLAEAALAAHRRAALSGRAA